jgi:hypothetical protein
LVDGVSFRSEMGTRVSEVFRVTFEVEVTHAAGGWNTGPIFDAVRACVSGATPVAFRALTVQKIDNGRPNPMVPEKRDRAKKS